jgi:hypothetical protein
LEEDCQTAVPDSESADRSGLAGWQRKPVAWAVFFEEPYLAVLRMDEPFITRTLRRAPLRLWRVGGDHAAPRLPHPVYGTIPPMPINRTGSATFNF